MGGRFRHSGRLLDREELKLLMLDLLKAGELHGYELIRGIKSMSVGAYAPSPGMVYPGLNGMADDGLVTKRAVEAGRNAFTLSETGRALVAGRADEVAAIRQRLANLSQTQLATHAPIERALANLDMVLTAAIVEAPPERIDAIVGLIDAAARDIERL